MYGALGPSLSEQSLPSPVGHTISEQLDLVPVRVPFEPERVIKAYSAYSATQFRDLKHTQSWLTRVLLHQPESAECRQCPYGSVESLPAAAAIRPVVHDQEWRSFADRCGGPPCWLKCRWLGCLGHPAHPPLPLRASQAAVANPTPPASLPRVAPGGSSPTPSCDACPAPARAAVRSGACYRPARGACAHSGRERPLAGGARGHSPKDAGIKNALAFLFAVLKCL